MRSKYTAPLQLPASLSSRADAPALLAALQSPSPTSVRINPLKRVDIAGEPVPWCSSGRYLAERPVFTLDPLLHAGCYYVQEASSMLLEVAFRRTGFTGVDVRALDLCAAPGGKTTHLAGLLTPASLLVCNEVVPNRRHVLCENLWKHGRTGVIVAGSPADRFADAGPLFDLVLVDAPCSGQGMFRKEPMARTQWSERLADSCAAIQADILRHAWEALAPGGYLIYSTCTWERRENEMRIEQLLALGGEHVPLPVEGHLGVETTDRGHRCYPHLVRGEGFFISLVHKPGVRPLADPGVSHPSADETDLSGLLDQLTMKVHLIPHGEDICALPDQHVPVWKHLQRHTDITWPGKPVATRKGSSLRPHPALALDVSLCETAFHAVDLDRQNALAYLRGETPAGLEPDPGAPFGVLLVRYEGHALGWMHAAGSRWNNGWPKPWRIRMR